MCIRKNNLNGFFFIKESMSLIFNFDQNDVDDKCLIK